MVFSTLTCSIFFENQFKTNQIITFIFAFIYDLSVFLILISVRYSFPSTY